MPTTLDVSCPNCEKPLKVPAEFEGKKIKCKDCKEVFVVRAPAKAGARAAAGKPAPKPAAAPPPPEEKPKSPFLDDEDERNPRAMGVVAEEDVPRCPHCAKELDPPDAKVCVHCGFNNVTRVKADTKKVWAPDASDWMLHLGPGVIALLLVIGLVVVDIVCLVNMRDWLSGSALELEEKKLDGTTKFIIPPGAFIAFIWAISIVVIIPAGRFAFRRLVLNYKPEERVKK